MPCMLVPLVLDRTPGSRSHRILGDRPDRLTQDVFHDQPLTNPTVDIEEADMRIELYHTLQFNGVRVVMRTISHAH